jgi:hypothetical protein
MAILLVLDLLFFSIAAYIYTDDSQQEGKYKCFKFSPHIAIQETTRLENLEAAVRVSEKLAAGSIRDTLCSLNYGS